MVELLQGGFLGNQKQPVTRGNAALQYDVLNGKFNLITKSDAKMDCEMDFSQYPFDTQGCKFAMTTEKNWTYQVKHRKNTSSAIISMSCVSRN